MKTRILLAALLVSVSLLPATRAADESPAGSAPGVILTPKPPAAPRINGPKIFGVRPGSPFLYSIPATGDRPMEFAVEGLPSGLMLDAATGRITGTLRTKGTHDVKLMARNALGVAEKPFKIAVGDEIALTPPMGWNSWNCWGGRIDQEKMAAAARAIVKAGLDRHGWTYVNIDDAWQGSRGGKFHAIQGDPEKFPDMKALCDEVHALGLKIGIYSSPWVTTYARRIGGSSENPKGQWTKPEGPKTPNKNILPWAIGKYKFATNDAKQWAEWGIDYLKYDWGPVDVKSTAEMDAALRATGRDIILSLSNNHVRNVFDIVGGLSKIAQAWRTTGDIKDTWKSVSDIGFSQDKWAPFQKPGHYNDPDMLVVGYVGWGTPHPTKLTPDEQYTHMSLWSLLSAPLLLGCDLEKLDDFTISLLTNDEVLAINQDTLCKQATQVAGDKTRRVYAKALDDGSWAVGLFNLGDKESSIAVKWSDIGIRGKQTVRDLWRQQDIGVLDGKFEAPVASHGAVLVRLTPAK
jgi:alpha-galactosidase